MSEYILQANETILFDVSAIQSGKRSYSRLMLTNINIVISYSTKSSIFSKAEQKYDLYPISDIKIYDGKPQFIQKGYELELLFLSYNLKLQFSSLIGLSKFKMALMKLLTGKSAQVRGAEKVKNGIGLVNDTLGVDSIDLAKNVLENGIINSLVGGFVSKTNVSTSKRNFDFLASTTRIISDASNGDSECDSSHIHSQSTSSSSYNEQLEAIKKLKELFDAGYITEEEFAAKKKEILNI